MFSIYRSTRASKAEPEEGTPSPVPEVTGNSESEEITQSNSAICKDRNALSALSSLEYDSAQDADGQSADVVKQLLDNIPLQESYNQSCDNVTSSSNNQDESASHTETVGHDNSPLELHHQPMEEEHATDDIDTDAEPANGGIGKDAVPTPIHSGKAGSKNKKDKLSLKSNSEFMDTSSELPAIAPRNKKEKGKSKAASKEASSTKKALSSGLSVFEALEREIQGESPVKSKSNKASKLGSDNKTVAKSSKSSKHDKKISSGEEYINIYLVVITALFLTVCLND